MTIAPNRQDGFSGSEAVRQPGNKKTSTALNDAFEHVIKNATKPEEYGEIYVNSHHLAVTAVEVRRGSPGQARVTIVDAEGDFQIGAQRARGDFAIVSSADWLSSEMHCGKDVMDDAL